jgi:hypothetical protein
VGIIYRIAKEMKYIADTMTKDILFELGNLVWTSPITTKKIPVKNVTVMRMNPAVTYGML